MLSKQRSTQQRLDGKLHGVLSQFNRILHGYFVKHTISQLTFSRKQIYSGIFSRYFKTNAKTWLKTMPLTAEVAASQVQVIQNLHLNISFISI